MGIMHVQTLRKKNMRIKKKKEKQSTSTSTSTSTSSTGTGTRRVRVRRVRKQWYHDNIQSCYYCCCFYCNCCTSLKSFFKILKKKNFLNQFTRLVFKVYTCNVVHVETTKKIIITKETDKKNAQPWASRNGGRANKNTYI